MAQQYIKDHTLQFDWEEFKSGKIAVNCDTEEKARDFLEKCKEKGLKWEGSVITVESYMEGYSIYGDEVSYSYCEEDLLYATVGDDISSGYKVIKWEIEEVIKMEKTFNEIMTAGIKENEIWEDKFFRISRGDNESGEVGLKIELQKNVIFQDFILIRDSQLFKLQRPQYTFTEAFKAYEDGKEIESCVSGDKWGEEIVCFNTIAIEDIKGKWYIN